MTGGEDQLIGRKDMFRVVLSLQVLDVIGKAGALTSCLSYKCSHPHETYINFVDGFHALYLTTSMSTNNPELLQDIEKAFYTDRDKNPWSYGNNLKTYKMKSWMYIDLFKRYMLQLKEDGMYNPEITYGRDETTNVWRDSIG